MPVTTDHILKKDEMTKWCHLIENRLPDIDSTVWLMIGNDVPDAYTSFEVETGPHATKTHLGWILWNLVRQHVPETYSEVKRAQLSVISDIEQNNKLEQLMNFDFPENL